MAGPLSYEPSVQAIIAELLPSSAHILFGARELRRRASWSVQARATGIGEIEGGELILVPASRAQSIIPRLRELNAAGIAGVFIAGDSAFVWDGIEDVGMPIVLIPDDTDVRKLQVEIERYIARRRRDLFALDQALHRSLTEAAIGGASLEALLAVAYGQTRRPVIFDRDGDLLQHPSDSGVFPDSVLMEARILLHGQSRGSVRIDGPPACLAVPVVAGDDRRGIVLVTQAEYTTVDEDEAIMTSLASACAIVVARTPEGSVPSLDAVLSSLARGDAPETLAHGPVVGVALRDGAMSVRQLERGTSSELAVRDMPHLSGSVRDILVVVAPATDSAPWESIARSIGRRLGTTDLSAGIGRPKPTGEGAAESCREALTALEFGVGGQTTYFHDIELASLLRATPGWTEFAHRRLGILLDGTSSHDDLLLTLRAYMASGRNAKEAAVSLHVHRNTMLYRLRRLREILGTDLDDQNVLFELELALRALDAANLRTATPRIDDIR